MMWNPLQESFQNNYKFIFVFVSKITHHKAYDMTDLKHSYFSKCMPYCHIQLSLF